MVYVLSMMYEKSKMYIKVGRKDKVRCLDLASYAPLTKASLKGSLRRTYEETSYCKIQARKADALIYFLHVVRTRHVDSRYLINAYGASMLIYSTKARS